MMVREGTEVKLVPRVKLWLEYKGEPVIGEGRANLLEAIDEHRSLRGACESLSISYRYGWGCIRKIEKRLGSPIVERFRGGYGKGGAKLTALGRMLLARYLKIKRTLERELKRWE